MNELQLKIQALLTGQLTQAQFDEFLRSNPAMAAQLAEQQAAKERGERTMVAASALDLLKNVGYTAFALNQIGTANRLQSNLTQPSIPQVPGLSPELTQAIYEAQRGVDYSSVIEPARQGIEDAYTGALGQAQTASGGQAGAYQAMAQLANIERMKANLGLAPIAQQVQMQNQGNLNNLLGMRTDERQRQYLNQLYGSQMSFDQYNNSQDMIGKLGATGTTNMLDAVGRVTTSLSNLPAFYQPSSTGEPEWGRGQEGYYGFDEDTQNYMGQVRNENIRNMNPYYQYSGIYQPHYGKDRTKRGTV